MKNVIIYQIIKFWLILCVLLAVSAKSHSQTQYSPKKPYPSTDSTKYTATGEKYENMQIFKSKTGSLFVCKVSKKTGLQYKYYLTAKKDEK